MYGTGALIHRDTVISWASSALSVAFSVDNPHYSVDAISVLFPTAENCQLFQCSEETVLNEWLPVDSVRCDSPTITSLQSQVGGEDSTMIQFGTYAHFPSLADESNVEITTLNETLIFKPQNHSGRLSIVD